MTTRPLSMRRSLTDYVDQVVRKEQFLADHPDVHIAIDPDASPYQRWRGQVPCRPEATSHDLSLLLDQLDDLVAARDAHIRWPDWAFTRTLSGWRAQATDGPVLVTGRKLEQVETRVAQHESESASQRIELPIY